MNESAERPLCRHDNPPENRFCGSCGSPLRRGELVPQRRRNLVTVGRALPARVGPAGKVLAVGAAALLAEIGLSWLRRRIGAKDRPSVPAALEGVDPALYRRLAIYIEEEVLITKVPEPYAEDIRSVLPPLR